MWQSSDVRRAAWIVAPGLALIGLAAWSWQASRHALADYVTPPLDQRGTRLRLRMPRGWRCILTTPRRNPQEPDMVVLYEPPPPRSLPWLPEWAPRWLRPSREAHAQLIVNWTHTNLLSDDRVNEQFPLGSTQPFCNASRSRRIPSQGSWAVSYNRENREAFRATYREIMDSVRMSP